jgi:hypothetical protein
LPARYDLETALSLAQLSHGGGVTAQSTTRLNSGLAPPLWPISESDAPFDETAVDSENQATPVITKSKPSRCLASRVERAGEPTASGSLADAPCGDTKGAAGCSCARQALFSLFSSSPLFSRPDRKDQPRRDFTEWHDRSRERILALPYRCVMRIRTRLGVERLGSSKSSN